jgi:predicted ATPase
VDLGFHRLEDLGHPERISQLSIDGLPSEFPALRSLDNPALLNNLPALSSSFIGRQLELIELRAAIASGRLVTLTGAGGAGKTRLALQVAAELLDGAGDGVWLVELAAVTDGTEVHAAIAAAIGITVSGEGALDGLLDALSHQHVLIVLDNCEHLVGSLVDKSLVFAEPAGQAFRYGLLETIRQFAAERLAEDPVEVAAVEQAHLEHFLAIAE